MRGIAVALAFLSSWVPLPRPHVRKWVPKAVPIIPSLPFDNITQADPPVVPLPVIDLVVDVSSDPLYDGPSFNTIVWDSDEHA